MSFVHLVLVEADSLVADFVVMATFVVEAFVVIAVFVVGAFVVIVAMMEAAFTLSVVVEGQFRPSSSKASLQFFNPSHCRDLLIHLQVKGSECTTL
jgi:hypothetical protein